MTQQTTITARLRGGCQCGRCACCQGAARIERLEAALREIIQQDWWDAAGQQGDEVDTVDGHCAEIARRALEHHPR